MNTQSKTNSFDPQKTGLSLRQKASTAQKRSFVTKKLRKILNDIIISRETLSWGQIAEHLSKQGLKWNTGNPLTANDLRSVVYRLQLERNYKNQVSPNTETFDEIKLTQIRKEEQYTNLETDKNMETPIKTLDKQSKRSKLLEEMSKAAKERGI